MYRLIGFCFLFTLGCLPELKPPGGTGALSERELVFGSGERCRSEQLCQLSPVVRFDWLSGAGELRLFAGRLTAYERRHASDIELSKKLSARQIPLQALSPDELRVTHILDAGEYALSLGDGTTIDASVAPFDDSTVLRRVWPSRDESGRFAVFCSGDALSLSSQVPFIEGAAVLTLPGEPGCFAVVAESGSELEHSPTRYLGRWVEPATLSGKVVSEVHWEPPVCEQGAQIFVGGCAWVEDDRIKIQSSQAGYWIVGGSIRFAGAFGAHQNWSLRGLTPRSQATLSVWLLLDSGVLLEAAPTVMTAAVRPHVIINEVLANPLGPEPQQEWIELLNDGTQAVQLDQWELHDSAGVSVLPPYFLEPGEYVLLVSESFEPELMLDPVPDENTGLIAVAQLGQSGLSNAGEALKLYDASGNRRSGFPAVKTQAGRSIARLSPGTWDDDYSGFLIHKDPGASPGSANNVR